MDPEPHERKLGDRNTATNIQLLTALISFCCKALTAIEKYETDYKHCREVSGGKELEEEFREQAIRNMLAPGSSLQMHIELHFPTCGYEKLIRGLSGCMQGRGRRRVRPERMRHRSGVPRSVSMRRCVRQRLQRPSPRRRSALAGAGAAR